MMKKIDCLVAVMVVIGGINWGLVGFFDFNLIQYLFGRTWVDRVIYVIIGIAALYQGFGWKSIQHRWKGGRK